MNLENLQIDVSPAADGTRLLVTVWAPCLRRGLTIPLTQELSLQIELLQNENIARAKMATQPPELADH